MRDSSESKPGDHRDFLKSKSNERLESYLLTTQDINAHYSDEGQLQSDYHKRFAFELIQNADDAMQNVNGEKKVRFEVRDSVLLVANTGRPIDEEDVVSLCTMSYTTKEAEDEKRASIGHKGRGFSSILEITEQPQIYSTGISFEFDRKRSKEAIQKEVIQELEKWSMDQIDGVPLMRLPFSPEKNPDRVEELLNQGYNTVFRFPLKDDQVEGDVIETITGLDRNTVLFLQELEQLEIDVEGHDGREWKIERGEKDWDSDDTRLKFVSVQYLDSEAGNSDKETFALFSRDEVEIGSHTSGIDENTWGDVKYTQIGLALRIREEKDGIHLSKLEESPFFHVFLPTEEQCPIPVLVNGAFHTAISRTNINVTSDDDNYNGFLLQQVANLLSTDVLRYVDQTATTVEEFIECLDFTDYVEDPINEDRLNGRFIRALRTEFADVEFIPRLEKLATGKVLSEPGLKSVSELVLPYYSSEKKEIAEAVARIYGNEKLELENLEVRGWFPKTTLLEPSRAAILEGLGAPVLRPEDIPVVLGSVPDEASPLYNYTNQVEELAVDPILEVLIWVWKTISGEEEIVNNFKEVAKKSEVFPVGKPDNGIVRHVAKTDDTEFFFPPRSELPDIDISGIQFLTPPVYRPEAKVDTQTQSKLVGDLKPDLEAIWNVSEFDFEEVVQAAVFPKLPSPQNPDADHSELKNKQVLEFIRRLGQNSVAPENPLPFIERDGTLHRLCLLPVPTREGGWKPAYKVYFGEEWQPEASQSERVEPLLTGAEIDEVPYLARPEDLPGNVNWEEEDEEEESLFDEWKRFFSWLGVARHIRLKPFFDPKERRQFAATNGIERPEGGSILVRLSEEDWDEYRDHLKEALDNSSMERREYDSIYKLQSIEFFNQFLEKANEDSDFAELFFQHLVFWWNEDLRDYRDPVLATSNQRTWGRRSQNCPRPKEKRNVGLNLWLWQLKRGSWFPSNQGRAKPEEVWMPTESVRTRFEIYDTVLLPVLSENVLETTSEAPDLLRALDIRHDPRKSFNPKDAEIITETIADIFSDKDHEIISDSLRQIKPVYRYLSELLPSLNQSRTIEDEAWIEAQERLSQIPVLSRKKESAFVFEGASDTYFVRSPDVLNRIPVENHPVFVLQEDEAVRFGTYFGLKDLERNAKSEATLNDEDEEKTKEKVEFLEKMAPFILCRLEAERSSQKLIENDINGMDAFSDNLTIVGEIGVDYQFDSDEEETVSSKPDFFLDRRGRGRNERPLPFVKSLPEEENQNRLLALALCEYLGVSQFEGIIALLNAETDQRRRKFLRLAGAPSTPNEIEGKRCNLFEDDSTDGDGFEYDFEEDSEVEGLEDSSQDMEDHEREVQRRKQRGAHDHPIYDSDELELQGSSIIDAEPKGSDSGGGSGKGDSNGGGQGPGTKVSQDYRDKVDKLGMSIALQNEQNRLEDDYSCESPENYVFDIHNKDALEEAQEEDVAGSVLDWLEKQGLPLPYPGFDILTINPKTEKADRLIEVKSSGVDTRYPPITWNEWKTASTSEVQGLYYLYIVGSLRKDVRSNPYIREICNPFDLLNAKTQERREVKKEVKVDVKSFKKTTEIREITISVNQDNKD